MIDTLVRVHFREDILELPEKKSQEFRILFLGTSQTWGGGARNLSESFAARFIKLLNQNQTQHKISALNLAEAGVESKKQLEQFTIFSEIWQADLIIANFGNNDFIESDFKKNLENLIRLTKEQHAQIVFIKEANSIEVEHSFLLQKHQLMQEIAQQNHIEIINLHEYINEKSKADAGLI